MSFKDVIASDVHDTFMNADEFSDMHDPTNRSSVKRDSTSTWMEFIKTKN